MRLRKRTIDSVLAVAQKVVKDLNELATQHSEKATEIRNDISDLELDLAVEHEEAERATVLAKKWSELV